jgi:hypothetical protein
MELYGRTPFVRGHFMLGAGLAARPTSHSHVFCHLTMHSVTTRQADQLDLLGKWDDVKFKAVKTSMIDKEPSAETDMNADVKTVGHAVRTECNHNPHLNPKF